MNKILPILIVGVLVIGGFGAIAFSDKKVKEEKMTLYFSKLSIKERDDRISLELEGANSALIQKDHYMVPTKIETFIFPFGTEITSVQCAPKNIHRQKLTKELVISPEPVIIGQISTSKISQKCENPIPIDTWFEYDVGAGINGNERCAFVKVQTFPVQYYPLENAVEWAENIEIDISYKEPEQTIMSFDEQFQFIVITPNEFSDELEELISHKISRNISTKLVTLDEIYGGSNFPVEGRDEPEKIKYFIKNAYDDWGTNNVLLVGSSNKFPTRESHVDDLTFVSDLYYADIYNETYSFSSWDTNDNDEFGEYNQDEVDLYPDLRLGRLACVDSNEVTACVNKIITYEINEAYTQDWFTNILLVGGDSFTNDPHYNDDSGINEGEYVNQAVIDIMNGFIPDKIWISNDRLNGISPTGISEITNAINSGCGFIDFSGHGNTNTYSTHPHNSSKNVWVPTPTGGFRNSHVADLENGDRLPIVVIGACSVGKFNVDPNCLAWSFVLNPNGGGIGSFGATTYGYAYIGKGVTTGLIEKMTLNVFEAFKDEAVTTFGEMWVEGINKYIFPRMRESDYLTIEEWQPFGDPTLAIGENTPIPAKPDKPEGVTSGGSDVEYIYSASTTDPDGDKIYYLFDWDDGEFSGYIGPYDSDQPAEASHTWREKGNYEIRVIAKDERGMISEWSDPLPISMPNNKQLFNSLFLDFLARFPRLFPVIRNVFEFRVI